jgi:hypothetical protein
MSDIRFNQWLHNSGTGGVSQVDGGHVGIGTTNPEIAVHSGNNKILNVGIVTASTYYGDGSNLTSLPAQATIANNADNRVITGGSGVNLNGESNLTFDGNNLAMSGTGVFTLTRNSRTLTLEGNYGNEGHPAIKTSSGHDLRIFTNGNNEKVRIHSNGDISIGDSHTSATQKVDILNGADEDNIVIIRGADATTEYAAIGVNGGNAVITGGSSGSNNVGIIFRTASSGTETQRFRVYDDGYAILGDTSKSSTAGAGGFDIQGNSTNCILEMGNPFPNVGGGTVPAFRITATNSNKEVDFESIWGGTNQLYKHITLSGGGTFFYDGTSNTEIVRITGSALMVGTTSNSANTQAKGIALNNDGAMISRRDGVMHYYKSISTGGYYANVFMSAQTTVGSIFFNSGGTQFNTSSDYRRKENVVSLTDGLSKLKQLKPYRFNFKDNPSETVDGFLAHEAQEIVPHTVTGIKDQVSTADDVAVGIATTTGEPIYQQMDLSKLVPLLTASLQELNTKVETLEAKVDTLEGS